MTFRLKFLAASLLIASQANAADLLAVMSPYGTPTQAQALIPVLQQQLASMDSGDTLTVLSGEDGETVTRFTVPDVPKQHRVRAIIGTNKQSIAQINAFVKNATTERQAGTINLPVVLNQLAAYHRDKTDILLLGSLSFDYPTMTHEIASGSSLPADSNLLKTSQESTFGTRDISGRFKGGYRFHWAVSQKAGSGHYYEGAVRFVFMYLHAQGADVVSITHDKAVVLERLNNNAQPLTSNYALQVERTDIPATLFDRALNARLTTPLYVPQSNISIAIRWDVPDVDLDIYALTKGQSEPVYFGNAVHQQPKARHLKDVQSGALGNAFLETIVFDEAVNGCEITVAVNHYSGLLPASGLKGAIRFAAGNGVFETPFTLKAARGNAGHDTRAALRTRHDTAHTLIFLLADIAGDKLTGACNL